MTPVSSPLFRCPVFDGAADPTVIHRRGTNEWWMFYTARRATLVTGGVDWITGTRIGIAVSEDGGASWSYRGVVEGLDPDGSPALNTHWAPEVVWHAGQYHMFLTWAAGAAATWEEQVERGLVHFVSDDLQHWVRAGTVDAGSENVIDAAFALVGDGKQRLWFKDELDGATTWSAVSEDMIHWQLEGLVIPKPPHEGPNVFRLGGWYWMVVDEWRGQAVYRSPDGLEWTRQEANNGLILDAPGSGIDDATYGRHADIVTQGDYAYIFYFTHPEWQDTEMANGLEDPEQAVREQRTSIQAALLHVEGDTLICTRDREAPVSLDPALL
ncbi:family 43 glycosylhydrolase [Arthrobacter sp. ISL-30]|uniref:family 43 glycosylhydrolase n=1 Tax=Arthrobacter sp. ISL-30 TaxID=2819109 RepID=UPI001BE92D41|nr:family 43 glycosylhydrolase [Arthrobacter sp. ISL-30]MBT2515012.1 family 43 glycosylhydrolase [Arthrobacter sp. ISL-30]